MTERKMGIKGFIHKSMGKVSAAAFLAAHRQFLLSEELAPVTSPILSKLDAGDMMPTAGLNEIRDAVYRHMVVSEARQAEEKLHRAQSSQTEKKYIATILDSEGNVQTRKNKEGEDEDLVKSFEKLQDAEGWCERRLNEGAPDWHGEILATKLLDSEGSPILFWVDRGKAVSRMMKAKPGAVMKGQSKAAGSLSFGVKAKPSHSTFSHG